MVFFFHLPHSMPVPLELYSVFLFFFSPPLYRAAILVLNVLNARSLSLSLSVCCCFFRFDNCRSDQFSLCIQLANISNAILFFLQLQQLATTSNHFAFNFILKSYHFSNKLYIISSGYFFYFFYFLLNRY